MTREQIIFLQEDSLKEMVKHYTKKEIALICGVSYNTIRKRFKKRKQYGKN